MKRLFISLSILLMSFTLNAQVLTIQATKLKSSQYNAYNKAWSVSDWTMCSVLIKIDIKNSIISIDNNKKEKFKVLERLKQNEGIDEGYSYTEFEYDCADKDDKRCIVIIRAYKTKSTAFFGVNYNNLIYAYEGTHN
jgi:hypothetical protein